VSSRSLGGYLADGRLFLDGRPLVEPESESAQTDDGQDQDDDHPPPDIAAGETSSELRWLPVGEWIGLGSDHLVTAPRRFDLLGVGVDRGVRPHRFRVGETEDLE
jgi:hypothetical protein